MTDEQAVDLATLTRGYAEAVQRFHEAPVTPTSVAAAYLPLFEALNWAVSIEQYLAWPKKHLTTENDDVRGMRFVRNCVHHDWATAIDFTSPTAYGEGAYGDGPYSGPSHWRWRPTADLPEPCEPLRPNQAADRDRYRDKVAGSRVASTLDRLSEFFADQRRGRDDG